MICCRSSTKTRRRAARPRRPARQPSSSPRSPCPVPPPPPGAGLGERAASRRRGARIPAPCGPRDGVGLWTLKHKRAPSARGLGYPTARSCWTRPCLSGFNQANSRVSFPVGVFSRYGPRGASRSGDSDPRWAETSPSCRTLSARTTSPARPAFSAWWPGGRSRIATTKYRCTRVVVNQTLAEPFCHGAPNRDWQAHFLCRPRRPGAPRRVRGPRIILRIKRTPSRLYIDLPPFLQSDRLGMIVDIPSAVSPSRPPSCTKARAHVAALDADLPIPACAALLLRSDHGVFIFST